MGKIDICTRRRVLCMCSDCSEPIAWLIIIIIWETCWNRNSQHSVLFFFWYTIYYIFYLARNATEKGANPKRKSVFPSLSLILNMYEYICRWRWNDVFLNGTHTHHQYISTLKIIASVKWNVSCRHMHSNVCDTAYRYRIFHENKHFIRRKKTMGKTTQGKVLSGKWHKHYTNTKQHTICSTSKSRKWIGF